MTVRGAEQMSPMRFAIILPTYNRARLLVRAVESVLKQDYTNWMLYIVNDGSRDDTGSVVLQYLSDPRIHYVENIENRGKPHSFNVALDQIEADGADWFTHMDDDDQLADGSLRIAREKIEQNPAVGMFAFMTAEPGEGGGPGKPISKMEIVGSKNYVWEKMLKKTVRGDTHEFISMRILEGSRFIPPAAGARIFWFGELSLRSGSFFCSEVTLIKEYLPDGISLSERRLSWRRRMELKLRLEKFIVRYWLSVIRRHPFSWCVYRVWVKSLRRVVFRQLRMWLRRD